MRIKMCNAESLMSHNSNRGNMCGKSTIQYHHRRRRQIVWNNMSLGRICHMYVPDVNSSGCALKILT